MKFIRYPSLLFCLLSALAVAQSLPHFQHIIIVVQENRTPDNLFGSDVLNHPRLLPGADLQLARTLSLGA